MQIKTEMKRKKKRWQQYLLRQLHYNAENRFSKNYCVVNYKTKVFEDIISCIVQLLHSNSNNLKNELTFLSTMMNVSK
jgi:hypothetical protein